MYPVSDAFLRAVRSNIRKYYWTGTIVTKGGMTYEFGAKEIVKGSGYISRQCCGSTEIELGTVYAAEMGITLLSDIDRYTLEDALVTLVFHLVLADGSVEDYTKRFAIGGGLDQMVFMAVGGWLGWFMGGCDGLLYALIAFVVIDYLAGVMCAFADHTLSSEVGFRGICRKVLSFCLWEWQIFWMCP